MAQRLGWFCTKGGKMFFDIHRYVSWGVGRRTLRRRLARRPSGITGVGIMGTFGCVIVRSHMRSWPSSTGISGMPLNSKRLLTVSVGSVMQVKQLHHTQLEEA